MIVGLRRRWGECWGESLWCWCSELEEEDEVLAVVGRGGSRRRDECVVSMDARGVSRGVGPP